MDVSGGHVSVGHSACPLVLLFHACGVVLSPPRSGYLLNMTSQTWLDSSIMNRPVWTHQLVVIVPANLKYNTTAGLYVTGGDNKNPGVPSDTDEDILVAAILATTNGVITGVLFQIPNAPIVFADDPSVRWCIQCCFVLVHSVAVLWS